MDAKESYIKTEEFAKKIVKLSADDGLTVKELRKAVDMAKWIANNSIVDKESIDKAEYSARYTSCTLNGKELAVCKCGIHTTN